MDAIARGEMVEAELSRMIERRDEKRRQTEGERLEESLWMKTVEAYNKREREGMLWQKLRFHESMIRAHDATHEAIITRHRAAAARCEALLGIETGEAWGTQPRLRSQEKPS